MRCLQCNYDLNHHRSNRCPECGKGFDPLLPETYRPDQANWRRYLPDRWMVAVVFLLSLGTLLFKVVPSFTVAEEHMGPGPTAGLSTIRRQLELYKDQTGGYPTLVELQNNWSVMLSPQTLPDGRTVGPYFQVKRVNRFNQSSTVAAPGQARPDHGWVYDQQSGRIRLVVSKDVAERWGLCEDDVIVFE